jgi:hypothetical protein
LSNEEITDTAWHDVEVTAPDSSGSVEIEADGVKDSLSVEIETEGVKSYCNGIVLDWTNLTSVSVSDICGSSTAEYFTLKGKGDIYYIRIGDIGNEVSSSIEIKYKNFKDCYIQKRSKYNSCIIIFPTSEKFSIDLIINRTEELSIGFNNNEKYIKCFAQEGIDFTPYLVLTSRCYYMYTIFRVGGTFSKITEQSTDSTYCAGSVRIVAKGYDIIGVNYFDMYPKDCDFYENCTIDYIETHGDWDSKGTIGSVIDKNKEFLFNANTDSVRAYLSIEPYELQSL